MTTDKASRQKQRMQRALESAFSALVREKGYEAVTVSDIAERANVGRTTFYRYFQSKADVLLSLHAERLSASQIAPTTRQGWLADDPPASLRALFEGMRFQGRYQPYLFQLGADADIIMRQMDRLVVRHFETSLRTAFPADAFRIPPDVLAVGLAGTFNWLLKQWSREQPAYPPAAMAAYAHHLLRAQVIAALEPST